MRRRGRLRPLLLIGFLALVVLEIALIVVVAKAIGVMLTIVLLIVGCGVGMGLIKSAGIRAWRAFNESARTGVAPTRELADSAVVLVGGLLFIVPGFATDLLGLVCALPFTRPLARRVLGLATAGRIVAYGGQPYAETQDGVHQIYRESAD